MNPQHIVKLWKQVKALPGGPYVFSKLLGKSIPYSGSIASVVRVLEPGHSEVELSDRRAVRNHLNCVHAVALMNLGELCSGLAVVPWLEPQQRGIVSEFRIRYHKKARGLLRARCHAQLPHISPGARIQHEAHVEIFNSSDEMVCEAWAQWTLNDFSKEVSESVSRV